MIGCCGAYLRLRRAACRWRGCPSCAGREPTPVMSENDAEREQEHALRRYGSSGS